VVDDEGAGLTNEINRNVKATTMLINTNGAVTAILYHQATTPLGLRASSAAYPRVARGLATLGLEP